MTISREEGMMVTEERKWRTEFEWDEGDSRKQIATLDRLVERYQKRKQQIEQLKPDRER